LPKPLAACGKFGDRSARRGFRHLAACIGIDLCVEDEDVYVLAGSYDVVKSSVADVVCPSVSAYAPYALSDQIVDDRDQLFSLFRAHVFEL
jgi:hypothetical protein